MNIDFQSIKYLQLVKKLYCFVKPCTIWDEKLNDAFNEFIPDPSKPKRKLSLEPSKIVSRDDGSLCIGLEYIKL